MHLLKKILDFYITGSIHVALSVYALVRMTQFTFGIFDACEVAYFAFFGTIVGYNFVKYDALARTTKAPISSQIKVFAVFSFISFLAAAYFFLQLQMITKGIALAFLILTMLYTLPFFPNKSNARNWAGVKIYIVTLCWVGVTVFLPIINSATPIFTIDVFLIALQRFILVFVLILIFEIIDLKRDDPHLLTVPQQIGIKQTKIIGSVLLLVFLILEFMDTDLRHQALLIKSGIAFTTFLFLLFANENRSKYYTSFWAESIPIVWWILLLLIFG